MKKLVTILIAIILLLICVIGLIISSAQGQEKNFRVEKVCEYKVKGCHTPVGGIRITSTRIYINSQTPSQVHVIRKEFFYKTRRYYDVQSDTCTGFFILNPEEASAILTVYTKNRGYYTAWYWFKKKQL